MELMLTMLPDHPGYILTFVISPTLILWISTKTLLNLLPHAQHHTRCSTTYCLWSRGGVQSCRFGYPKQLQAHTAVVTGQGLEPEVLTAQNDSVLNNFNPVQLSAWLANVDIQYCISLNKVIQYCAKYATKRKPHSQTLKNIFSSPNSEQQQHLTQGSTKALDQQCWRKGLFSPRDMPLTITAAIV